MLGFMIPISLRNIKHNQPHLTTVTIITTIQVAVTLPGIPKLLHKCGMLLLLICSDSSTSLTRSSPPSSKMGQWVFLCLSNVNVPTPFPPPRLLIKSRCLRNADSSSQVPYTSPTGCISQFSVSPLFPSSLIQPTFAPCLSTHLNPSCQHSLNLSPSSPMLQPIRTILLIPGHGLDDDHLLFDLKVD